MSASSTPAYALTVHMAQGQTVDTTHVLRADRSHRGMAYACSPATAMSQPSTRLNQPDPRWPTASTARAPNSLPTGCRCDDNEGCRERIGKVGCHVEIDDSARRHGIDDHDILHAISHPWRTLTQAAENGSVDRVLIIGPSTAGTMLEVVVLDPLGDDPAVIHAMTARPKFLKPHDKR